MNIHVAILKRVYYQHTTLQTLDSSSYWGNEAAGHWFTSQQGLTQGSGCVSLPVPAAIIPPLFHTGKKHFSSS